MSEKLIIVGLDGATLDLILPWVSEGRLPAFKRMIHEGTIGPLRSTIHPVTAPAWVSFMTGVNPGKHGIYDFIRRKPNSYDVELIYAGNLRRKTLWTLLSEAGKKVGVINVPMTYPPQPVNGFLISGIDTPGLGSPFTYPAGLFEEIGRNVGKYIIAVSGNTADEWAKGFRTMVDTRTRVFDYLRHSKAWDCIMVVYSATDMSQHVFWSNMQGLASDAPSRDDLEYGGVILEVYQSIDDMLGQLMDEADDDTTIMIMSDHGAGPLKRAVYMNRWLEEQGWLALRDSTERTYLASLGRRATRAVLRRALYAAKQHVPHRARGWLKRTMPGVRDSIEGFMVSSLLDWSRTRAFVLGSYGSIYLNLEGRDPQGTVKPGRDAEELCNQIISGLENLTDPVTGERVVKKVHRREELYWGENVDHAADLIVEWANYEYDCRQRFGKEETSVFSDEITFGDLQDRQNLTGVHRLFGTLMLRGRAVLPGHKIEGSEITDLAPTVLYLLGQPVPRSMDGHVLIDAFDEHYLDSHPVTYSEDDPSAAAQQGLGIGGYTDEESRTVQDRLEGLGYLQ